MTMKIAIMYFLLLASLSLVDNIKKQQSMVTENVKKVNEISLCDTYRDYNKDKTLPLHCFCSPGGDKAKCTLDNNSKVNQSKWNLLETIKNISHLILEIGRTEYQTIPFYYLNDFLNLKHLTFEFSFIMTLPEYAFSNLNYITHLTIRENVFRNISSMAIANLANLKWLRINNNTINSIPKDMFLNLPSLISLDLRSNKLSGLSNCQFKTIPALRRLILNHNSLNQVAERNFEGLRKLHHLYLSFNKLTTIGNGSFRGMRNLRTLNIASNQIENVEPGAFTGIRKLISLSLRDNQIDALDESTFKSLSFLTKLDLRNNKLVTLPFIVIEPFFKNYFMNENLHKREFHLSGNNLECSCSLAWMYPLAKIMLKEGLSYAFKAEDTLCYFKVSCTTVSSAKCCLPYENIISNITYSDEFYLTLTKIKLNQNLILTPPKEHIYFKMAYVNLIDIPVEALHCQINAAKYTFDLLCLLKLVLFLWILLTT